MRVPGRRGPRRPPRRRPFFGNVSHDFNTTRWPRQNSRTDLVQAHLRIGMDWLENPAIWPASPRQIAGLGSSGTALVPSWNIAGVRGGIGTPSGAWFRLSVRGWSRVFGGLRRAVPRWNRSVGRGVGGRQFHRGTPFVFCGFGVWRMAGAAASSTVELRCAKGLFYTILTNNVGFVYVPGPLRRTVGARVVRTRIDGGGRGREWRSR